MPYYGRRRGLSSAAPFINNNPVIAGRHAGDANIRANRANEAYTDSTNLSTVTRQAEALQAAQASKAQAGALESYYKEPEATRGPVGSYVAPRLAGIDPAGAMAMTQGKEQQDEQNFGTFLAEAQKSPQAALAFAKSKGIEVNDDLAALVSNTYFSQQLNSAFKAAQAQYPGRPDLKQKAIRKATAEILGNMAAAKESGQPLPGGQMGYSLEGMPQAPGPAPAGGGAAGGKAPTLRSIYDEKTGREQKVYWDPASRSFTPVGGVEAAPAGRSTEPTSTDRLKHASLLREQAIKVAMEENPDLYVMDAYGNPSFKPEFVEKSKEVLTRLQQRFPLPGEAAQPAATGGPGSTPPPPAAAPAAPAAPAVPPPPQPPNTGTVTDPGAWSGGTMMPPRPAPAPAAPSAPTTAGAPPTPMPTPTTAAPAAPPATAPIPGAPYQGDAPPPDQPTAQLMGDGKWYVQQGDQWFMVVN